MAGLKKSLSNDQHVRVLETIGMSSIPISSRQIEKVMVGSNSYVYSIVRELAGIDEKKNTVAFLRVHNKYDSIIEEIQMDKKLVPDINILTDRGSDYVVIPNMTEEDEKKKQQILKFQSNIRNYRYSVTLKGLLLYLQKAYDIRKIESLLTNLSENFLEEFPFLWFYRLFKSVLGRRHIVPLLKDIAIELQNQLDIETNAFLRYWVMKRYFHEIHGSLPQYDNFDIFRTSDKLDVETHRKLKDYRLYMLQELIKYEQEELSKTLRTKREIEGRGLFAPFYIH